jgi:hypothetical protein
MAAGRAQNSCDNKYHGTSTDAIYLTSGRMESWESVQYIAAQGDIYRRLVCGLDPDDFE